MDESYVFLILGMTVVFTCLFLVIHHYRQEKKVVLATNDAFSSVFTFGVRRRYRMVFNFMGTKKNIGGGLIIGGIILLIHGFNELNSIASILKKELGYTNAGAYMAICAGGIGMVSGLAILFSKK